MKNWPFNTGDCLMQVAFMTGLTIHIQMDTVAQFYACLTGNRVFTGSIFWSGTIFC